MRFGYIDEYPVSMEQEATTEERQRNVMDACDELIGATISGVRHAEEVRTAFDQERIPWDCRSRCNARPSL